MKLISDEFVEIDENKVILHNAPKRKQYLPGVNKTDTPQRMPFEGKENSNGQCKDI